MSKRKIKHPVTKFEPVIVKHNQDELKKEGFLPIELLDLVFKQTSHTVSNTDDFLFYDTDRGEVIGFAERFDRTVGGEEIKADNVVFLDENFKRLLKVTHFKTL